MVEAAQMPIAVPARLLCGSDAQAVRPLRDAIASAPEPAEGVRLLRGRGAAWADMPRSLAMRLAAALRPWPGRDEIRAFDSRAGTVVARDLGNAIVDPDRIADTIDRGGTIVFQKLDSLDFHWHRLVRAFEGATRQPAQVNVYAGAPGAPGLAWHRDPHDVLVLQLAGTKCFAVGGGAGAIDIPLVPGDMLWLDRGVRHRATNGAAGSIHASLGLLHWMLDRMGVPVVDRRPLAPPVPPCPLSVEERGVALLGWRPFRELPVDLVGGDHLRPDLLALIHPARGKSFLDLGGFRRALAPDEVTMIAEGQCPPGLRPWLGARLAPARSLSDLLGALDPGDM
jgi:quercetin dioxygenase-like cupin family protein